MTYVPVASGDVVRAALGRTFPSALDEGWVIKHHPDQPNPIATLIREYYRKRRWGWGMVVSLALGISGVSICMFDTSPRGEPAPLLLMGLATFSASFVAVIGCCLKLVAPFGEKYREQLNQTRIFLRELNNLLEYANRSLQELPHPSDALLAIAHDFISDQVAQVITAKMRASTPLYLWDSKDAGVPGRIAAYNARRATARDFNLLRNEDRNEEALRMARMMKNYLDHELRPGNVAQPNEAGSAN